MTRAPAATARAAQAAETRESILLAAISILEERGFDASRVSDVATRAGVSHGLVLYYFASREELLTAALQHSEDTWFAEARERAGKVEDPRDRLRLLIELAYEGSDHVDLPSSWMLWLDMWQQALRNAGFRDVVERLDRQWRDILAATVRDGQARGLFASVDADEFARMLSSMQDGLSVSIAMRDSTLTTRDAVRMCLRFCALELTVDGEPPIFDAGTGRERR
jgi:AcrR family transcriptional regulator